MKLFAISIVVVSFLLSSFINTKPISTKTTENHLTSKTWKTDEIRMVQRNSNKSLYYKRDVFGNDYDADSIKFNTDQTGVYYYNGSQYKTTWSFLDDEKTRLKLTIKMGSEQPVFLDNVNVTESHFRYAQYDALTAPAYIATCSRIPN